MPRLRTTDPTILLAPAGDGWWPVLSPNATLVAFGNTDLRVVDLKGGGVWPVGAGRHLRFLNDATVTWTREIDPTHHARWQGDLKAWTGGAATADDPALVAGNTFDARHGHWASWLDAEQRVVRDNVRVAHNARGVSVYGDHLLTVENDAEFVVYHNGLFASRLPLPTGANSWKLQARGWIPFGYWGPSQAYDPDGLIRDLTVTPYRQEGLASLVWTPDGELWVWTATERPGDLKRALLGRPFGSTDCVIIEHDGFSWLDAGWANEVGFVIAGCSDLGACQVWGVPRNAERRAIDRWAEAAPGPEPPEPGPEPAAPPKVTISSYAPTSGPVPLSVTAVAEVSARSGPVTTLEWRFRSPDSGTWSTAARNPATDLDHTYGFAVAGTYELSLRATGPGGEDQTGSPRIVTATEVSPPVPPEPEPQPPHPEPPALAEGDPVSLQCWDKVHYWCAEEGGGVEGDGRGRATASRTEVGGWESFKTASAPDGRIGFQAIDSGAWLCAEDTGDLWFNRKREAGYVPGAWEAFAVEPGLSGGATLKTDHGTYVQAVGGGGSDLVHRVRVVGHSEAAETFFPSRPLLPLAPGLGGVRVLQGRVRLAAWGLCDDIGHFLPVFYHHGDAGLDWMHDPGRVKRVLDVTQPAGQMGSRTWLGRLLPTFWDDFILSETLFRDFQHEYKQRNMRIMWDGGDLGRASREERDRVRQILLDVGDRDTLASVSMCNEGNGNSDMSVEEMADWLWPIAEKWPDLPVWVTTGGAGHEFTNHLRGVDGYSDEQNMDRYNPQGPARLVGKHGWRDGSVVDKARHCFSFVYEGQPESWLTVDDEPPGVSDFVSVIQNREQLRDPAGVATIFLTACTVGQWWVFFPGIEQQTEPAENFRAHFERLAQQAAQLPADLWTYDDLEHGGPTQSRRVWEVTDTGSHETARCDHALQGGERYVCSNYDEGPSNRQNFRQIKGTEDSRIENPPWGFVSVGRQG